MSIGQFPPGGRLWFFLLLALILWPACMVEAAAPSAVDGFLDLSDRDFQAQPPLYLNGEWEFYWSELLSPADFGEADVPPPGTISIPGSWNRTDIGGRKAGGDGYATYRLRVRLPPDLATPDSDVAQLGLYLPWTFSAYRMWVNGQLAAENGRVGVTRSDMIPQFKPTTVWISPSSDTLDIVIQVSNFSHRNGGLWNSPLLGSSDRIIRRHEARQSLDTVLFGAIAFMGLYQIALYLLFRERPAHLHLAVTSLAIAVRTLVTSEHVLDRIVGVPWHMEIRIEYLTGYILTLAFTAYVRAAFPGEVPAFVTWSVRGIGWTGIATALLTPVRFSSRLIIVFEAAIFLILLFACWRFLTVVYRRKSGSNLILLGSVILLLTLIHDLLHYNLLGSDYDLLPLGLFFLLLMQSINLAQQFAGIYRREVALSKANADLLATVKAQLSEVKQSRRTIAAADEHLRQSIAERLHGRVQSQLLIVRQRLLALKGLIAEDPDQAREVADAVVRDVDQVREKEIRQVGHLLHPSIVKVGLMPAIESLVDRFAAPPVTIDVKTDDRLDAYDDPDDNRIPETVRLTAYRVLEEALANVYAHANARHVEIRLSVTPDESLEMTVRDDGRGFAPERFEPGIGMKTIAARAGAADGTWSVEGRVGEGVTVRVALPLKT